MKKALVWKEAHAGRVVGQIERIGEASEIDSWTSYLKEKMETVEVPVGLEEREQHELETIIIPEVPGVDEVLEDVANSISYAAAIPAIPEHYGIQESDIKTKEARMGELRGLRDSKYQEVKEQLNKHSDADSSAIATEAEWRAYRILLRDVTEQFKNLDGSTKVAIKTANLSAALPTKPV